MDVSIKLEKINKWLTYYENNCLLIFYTYTNSDCLILMDIYDENRRRLCEKEFELNFEIIAEHKYQLKELIKESKFAASISIIEFTIIPSNTYYEDNDFEIFDMQITQG